MGIWALLGNILWIFVGGAPGALFWLIASILLAITVIGLPFSFAAFRIARFALLPFGQSLLRAESLGERRVPGTTLANILWFILAGVWLALYHAVVGVLLCLTIIGIPFGLAHFRLAQVSLAPLGRRVIFSEQIMPRVE